MARVSLDTLIRRSFDNMGDVHSAVKDKVRFILHQAYQEGINAQISSGFRSFARQRELFNQGRYGNPGNIVTNAEPGQSVHNYGLAVDYFLTTWDGSKATWNVNKDWRRVADIGKSLGFEWGGDWSSFRDYPHLQLTGGLNWRDLKAGRRPSDELLNEGVTQRGHSGWDTSRLQVKLNELGHNLTVDGIFGPGTEKAFKSFQRAHNLTVDGLFGPNSQDALKEALNRYESVAKKPKQEEINMAETGFKDVEKDDYYAKALQRLVEQGVIEGFNDDTFRPDETLKRKDFVVALDRAINK